MNKLIFVLSMIVSLNSFAQSEKILCSAPSTNIQDSTEQLLQEKDALIFQTIHNGKVIDKTVIDSKREQVWDGHAFGLITAKGLSLSYTGNYGCTDDVQVVVLANRGLDATSGTLLRKVSFGRCLGMSASFCK